MSPGRRYWEVLLSIIVLPRIINTTRIRRGRGTVSFTIHPALLTPLEIQPKIRIHTTRVARNTFQLNVPSKSTGSVAVGRIVMSFCSKRFSFIHQDGYFISKFIYLFMTVLSNIG